MNLNSTVALMRKHSLYLLIASALVTLIAVYLALIWVPSAKFFTAPNAQRIFYFHVPAAWVCYLAFGILALASGAYLRTENPSYDRWARAAAELAFVFGTVTLVTGTIWMRAEWLDSNAEIADHFLWDTRLSITLVMWFILIAYFVLRSSAPAEEGSRLCSILGVFGFFSVPLSFISARVLKSNHPNPIASSEGSISPDMIFTMNIGLVAFTLLLIYLLLVRTQIFKLAEQLDHALYLKGEE